MVQYDLIIVSCKAYDLDGAIKSFAPAVHEKTVIIPLLNGLRHLDVLNARFGEKRVFGGQCAISAALSAEGEIVHLSDLNTLSFGEQNGARSERRDEIVSALSGATLLPNSARTFCKACGKSGCSLLPSPARPA